MTQWTPVPVAAPRDLAGPDAWALVGTQQACAAVHEAMWGHGDAAWGLEQLQMFLNSREDERTEILAATAPGAPAHPDSVLGAALVSTPQRDNLHLAYVDVWVRPEAQRRGIGSQLLTAAELSARRQHRTTVIAAGLHGTATDDDGVHTPASGTGRVPVDDAAARFAARRGYALEQVERFSTARFPVDLDHVVRLHAAAAAAAGGDYRLVSWEGPVPERWLDGYAALRARMSTDAPLAGLALDEEAWDAERVRRVDRDNTAAQRGGLSVAVEHVASGTLVAFTVVEWPLARPAIAFQQDTLVAAPHRGRRLGMLVKTEQFRLLATVLPALRRLHTWNAAENEHMLAINTELGFEEAGIEGLWQRVIASEPAG